MISAVIEEQGNGLPDEGDYVIHSKSGSLYRVVSFEGRIFTGPPGSGNRIHAILAPADWDDCPEGEESDCKVTL